MLIRDNPNASKLAIPVTQRARLTVDRALVTRQIRGEPIGGMTDLVLLTGARTLTDLLLKGARQFVDDYRKKGYEPLQEPNEFIVWGPYHSRGFGLSSAKPTIAHLSAEGEEMFPESADFVIQGNFLATRGKVPALQ